MRDEEDGKAERVRRLRGLGDCRSADDSFRRQDEGVGESGVAAWHGLMI